ncbi:bifunctional tetrahydrofolate synthase/dihydrofolate synthase [Halomonas sp. V046]|uniref:bifunctional tetrahydrofolate synthase/dihydrofolate synthase n=1 Tax=Halomonas sp. V046 TaxID=3459611 RepID=UPI004044A3B3
MTDQDLPTTLDAWLARLEASHPVGIDLGLDRVAEVAARMGLREAPIAERVITVAGTNGKGSTVAMLDALGRAHGLSVATYTSPHLVRYNERLRLDDSEADDALLMAGFAAVERARRVPTPVSLSYFEVGTLGALWAIAQRQPELAVLEVGLGGRLDAVNVIDADVAVVTTIAQDHAAYLGDDIDVIGREKAGIMRKARPAVLGSTQLPPSVMAHARAIGAPAYRLGEAFDHQGDDEWTWYGVGAEGQAQRLAALPDPGLPRDNAASALQALALGGVALREQACREALATVVLAGRMQWRGQWCLDVGHNPHAASYLARRLGARRCPGRTIALLGMLEDKDADGVIAALGEVVDAWLPVTLAGPRARSADDLARRLEERGYPVLAQGASPEAGAAWLETRLEADDRVLVTGSFFTVGAILARWQDMAGDSHGTPIQSTEGAR